MSINPAAPLTVSPSTIAKLYDRVRRGVALLDRRVPNWRRTMRKHQGQYDFMSGEHCVLGTLEHYNGRMRVIRKRAIEKLNNEITGDLAMDIATRRLRIVMQSTRYGFCWDSGVRNTEGPILHELWQREFAQDPEYLKRRG